MSIRTTSNQSELKKKTHLIQYMKKLTNHILQDNSLQNEIFNNLNAQDLQMLFESLVQDNIELRKTAAKFICYLIYQNHKIQKIMLQKEKVCVNQGNFIIGGVSQRILPKNFTKVLRVIASLQPSKDQSILCWIINIDTCEVNWRHWKDQSQFFDPASHVFGVFIQPNFQVDKKSTQKNSAQLHLPSKMETSNRVNNMKKASKTNSFK